jgi:hypothetical protein
MGDVLLRAGDRHPLGLVKEVLRDWKSLSHAKLFELVGPASHDGNVKAYLSRPAILSRQYGRCFWDPELVEQDAEAERAGRHLPRPSGAPRLFLSYRWTYDDDDLGSWVEEFASWLFNRGYDIVYDRDPRHVEKGFSSNDLLALLPSCSQMIALVTDGYQGRIRDPHQTSPVCQEFALAPRLYSAIRQPRLLGLWIHGEHLYPPFSSDWIVDVRDYEKYLRMRDTAFPMRTYQVTCLSADGTKYESAPIRRIAVRPLVHELLAKQPGQRVLVRDVTSNNK